MTQSRLSHFGRGMGFGPEGPGGLRIARCQLVGGASLLLEQKLRTGHSKDSVVAVPGDAFSENGGAHGEG
jgi:hypothetical protein